MAGVGRTVSAILTVMDPNGSWLGRTISSLQNQTRPPDEILIIDSSEEKIDAPMGVSVVHMPGLGIGAARQRGQDMARGDVVMHMDEDAVLRPEYIERGLERLSEAGVSAVGGPVKPLRGNPSGWIIAIADVFNPSKLGTHHLMMEKDADPSGASVFSERERGEDITQRRHLQREGSIVKDGSMVGLKDLPTTRQQIALRVLGAAAAGGVAAATASRLAENR